MEVEMQSRTNHNFAQRLDRRERQINAVIGTELMKER